LILSIEELGLAALFALAFANGANDAGKSVAALMMPGPSGSPPKKRKPLIWEASSLALEASLQF